MIPLGAVLAYAIRQVGRVLALAFAWATTMLFGRVPPRKQLVLSVMAISALAWPVAVVGIVVPSFATFLFAFVTIPDWANAWLRPVMLALALLLPAVVGGLTRYLETGTTEPLWQSIVRGYPTTLGLFVVLAWMLVLAPLVRIQAILRRWSTAHVPIAVKPRGYDKVVRDVAGALRGSDILVRAREAGWAFQLPGRLLAVLGGPRVRRLVPTRLVKLVTSDLEIIVHPMDLSMRGKEKTVARARAAITRELTFTEAYQTWSPEAQTIEDRLVSAARGGDDLDDIGRALARMAIDHEQWEVLYRLFLQVKLRASPVETDALAPELEPHPPIAQRLQGIRKAMRALWPPKRRAA